MLVKKPSHVYPVRQQVQFVEDFGGYVTTLGELNSVDKDFKVAWRVRDFQIGIYDILGATIVEDTYRADSYVRMQSADELRSAGQDYPEWIRDRYITLPQTVPESVLSLAIELTATEGTPYDRALAIEQYLRKIPYTLDVSTGPAGADIVEYFLFRLQKGYCDYYASAMVVLARAAGIPARYVVGYIGEYYDESEDAYIITADQAHAWADVYFPGYGWISFEPTGGRAAIDRPEEPIPELPPEYELDFSPLVPEREFPTENWLTILVLVISALILIILIGWRISDWWLERLEVDRLLPKLYRKIYRTARWAGLQVKPGDTAFRFADSLNLYFTQIGEECYWSEWFLEGIGMVREMTLIYVQCLFSSLIKDIQPVEVMQLYKQLRRRLWMLLLLGKAYPYPVFRPFLWENPPLLITIPLEDE
jgi:transglutaminase-like putative cysteine protease